MTCWREILASVQVRIELESIGNANDFIEGVGAAALALLLAIVLSECCVGLEVPATLVAKGRIRAMRHRGLCVRKVRLQRINKKRDARRRILLLRLYGCGYVYCDGTSFLTF